METKSPPIKTFDSFAHDYDEYLDTISGIPWLGWENAAGESAIDIGCGSGHTAEFLSTIFNTVVGIDVSHELIEIARNKRNKANIDYIVSDFMEYEITDTFDFVYSHTMMHHIQDYRAGLERIKLFVKKGGRLVVVDNVSDTYPTPPRWAYTLPAKISFIPNVFTYGLRKACKLIKFWHNPKWLRHLASDRYLSRNQFHAMYEDVFPDCEIIDLGYANAMKWYNA